MKGLFLRYGLLSFLIAMTVFSGEVIFSDSTEDGKKGNLQSSAILDEFRKILSVDMSYEAICQIATFIPGKKPFIKRYILYNKGQKSLLVSLAPERERGKKMLLIKDRIWEYFPRIRKTMVINSAMFLSGGVNLTDVVSSSLFRFYRFADYQYNKSLKVHVLTFTAIGKNSPYGKVVYYYANRQIRYFEAYARSGILLKKIYFVKYEPDSSGRIYPAQIKMVNALREGDYSLVQISGFKLRDVPDYFFNASGLDKAGE